MVLDYNKKHYIGLISFIAENANKDFYITKNNVRILVKDIPSIKDFLSSCKHVYIAEDRDIVGLLGIWKSVGLVPRTYIKILCPTLSVADKLISVLLWNQKEELYIKIDKFSNLIPIFKSKGFRFIGDRGHECLLYNNNKFIKTKTYNKPSTNPHSKKEFHDNSPK